MTKDEAWEMIDSALEQSYYEKDIINIRAALAQPSDSVEQEPTKDWVASHNEICALLRQAHDALALTSYPPKRPWVGLTDKDIDALLDLAYANDFELVRHIESKIKEFNHGI